MSGGKGAQPAGNTTTTQLPPSYMLPQIATVLGQGNNLLASGGPQYYPGNTVADFSRPQQQAMQRTFNMGMGKTGQQGLDAANQFDKTLLDSGGGSNPYLDQTYQHAAEMSQNQLGSEFAGAGRNVSAAAPLRAEQLNNLATDIYGGAYQNDIQNALAAGNQAQSIYGTRMQGLNAANAVGQQVQSQAQKKIDADQQRFNYYQQLPWQTLQNFQGILQGVQPGSSQTSPYFSDPAKNLQQDASTAAALYNLFAMMA